MTSIALPTHISFKDWILDLNRTFPGLIVPIPMENDSWWKSSMLLISINGSILSHVILPLKSAFPKEEDWKKWAFMFIQSITDK